MKLGRFSVEELSIFLWWSRLAEKLAVYGIIELVVDTATDTKREMRPNNFGMPSLFLYFS